MKKTEKKLKVIESDLKNSPPSRKVHFDLKKNEEFSDSDVELNGLAKKQKIKPMQISNTLVKTEKKKKIQLMSDDDESGEDEMIDDFGSDEDEEESSDIIHMPKNEANQDDSDDDQEASDQDDSKMNEYDDVINK